MPHLVCNRFIATLQDPYKQVQYNDVLKTLQEEHRLLQDMEAALLEIRNVPTTSGRSSLVRWASTVLTVSCEAVGGCSAASMHCKACQAQPV